MKTLPHLAAIALLAATTSLFAQDESGDELVKKLRGQAGKTTGSAPTAPGGLTTRGLKTRGLGTATSPVAPASTTETRSLILSTRGIPKAVTAAAEENKVALTTTTAPASTGAGDYAVAAGEQAVALEYKVDPESKVARDNILFRKGSADFADDASVEVVVTLAEALKHPELKGLQFVIEGHASAEGQSFSNQLLSQQRAERIVSVLTSLGVDEHCLLPVGFGETQARFPETSPDALLKQDRRVLIFRLDR